MGTDAKVVVRLSIEERLQLEVMLNEPRLARDRGLRIRMLLKADADGPTPMGRRRWADADGPAWPDSKIAEAFDVSVNTVARLRHRCVFEGLEAATARRPPRGTKPRKLDGEAEARLVALTCSKAPEGAAKWTMQMLADKLVELKIVDEISDETVRKTQKKTSSNPGARHSGSSHRMPVPSLSARWKMS
jgi:transposase